MGPSVRPSVHKMCLSEPFWAILGGFRAFSRGFGGLFGPFWVVFRPLQGVSEAFLALLSGFQAILRAFRGIFGPFWALFGGFGGTFGSY